MLTRKIQETNGSIEFFGYSVQNEMEFVKKFIGLCPQEDVLCITFLF
jgi:ABC-type multidrug transport system ATPase subunit